MVSVSQKARVYIDIFLQSRTVDIPQDVLDALKQFRFKNSKGTSAISGKFAHLL